MITAEILAKRLCDEGLDDWSGMYCDYEGLAHLCATSERTVRRWQSKGVGPQATRLSRVLFDLATVADWLNAGGLQKTRCWPLVAAGVMDTDSGSASNPTNDVTT